MDKEQLDAMATRIKEKRRKMHLTQEQAVAKLNISYSSYTKIENGLQNPSLDTLIDISLLLKMTLDEIIFGYDDGGDENNAEIRALMSALKSCDKEKLAYAAETLERIVSFLK